VRACIASHRFLTYRPLCTGDPTDGEPSQGNGRDKSQTFGLQEDRKLSGHDPDHFGDPNNLLACPVHPPPCLADSAPDTGTPGSIEYLTGPELSIPGPSRQQSTLRDIPPVPSSKTPSPMKMPQGSGEWGEMSPAKVQVEVTRALQDSIASLLGKRRASEEDVGTGTGAKAAAQGGKRARPQSKSKVCPVL
jgi:hypothetical protein